MIFVGYPNGQKGYKFLTQLLGAWSCRRMRSFTRTSPGVIMRRQVRSLLSLTTLAPSPHQQMDDVDMVTAPACCGWGGIGMCCRNSRRISVESTYEATFMNSLENRPHKRERKPAVSFESYRVAKIEEPQSLSEAP